MRVIMSMNVLMPSWSYLLLMSNVLFIHSLAISTFRTAGERAKSSGYKILTLHGPPRERAAPAARAGRSRGRSGADRDTPIEIA